MHILLVAATPFEIAPTLRWLEGEFEQTEAGVFQREKLCLQTLVTGVGMVSTAFQLGRMLALQRPDWVWNAGIAGAFDPDLKIGDLLQVRSERYGDLGIEEADGRFTDLAEMGFVEANLFENPQLPIPKLPQAQGLTVNKVHGAAASIQKIREKYPSVQLESMEGAAFFQVCLEAGLPFAELRSISNRVEPRNREAWDLPLAVKNLNELLVEMLDALAPGAPGSTP